MQERCIAVMNQKGGVIKTSTCASIAGTAANEGWPTLLVDFDPQGDLDLDLGYEADTDAGASLAASLRNPAVPVNIRKGVRPNLDVISGGPEVGEWLDDLNDGLFEGTIPTITTSADVLDQILTPIAHQYALIVIDTPPGERLLRRLVLQTANYVLLTSKADRASRRGLSALYGDINKWAHPDLGLLGVSLGPIASNASLLRKEARAHIIEETRGQLHVFETVIRQAERAAVDARQNGLLPTEYSQEAANQDADKAAMIADVGWSGWLKKRRKFSGAAADLATDYQDLAAEVLARFTEQLETNKQGVSL